MDNSLKEILWHQLGASIDMLKKGIIMCPSDFWDTDKKFWYQAYHSLFFLDYYLTINPIHFSPPPPFSLSEFEDRMPERVYSKEELLAYLRFCRKKCHQLIASMTEEISKKRWINESKTMNYSLVEIIIYNMRHVQHHVAQLNLLLRQEIDQAPEWICETEDSL